MKIKRLIVILTFVGVIVSAFLFILGCSPKEKKFTPRRDWKLRVELLEANRRIDSGLPLIYMDSVGHIIPDSIANKMLATGEYENWDAGLYLYLFKKKSRDNYINDKPVESKFFSSGTIFPVLNIKDLLGENVSLPNKKYKAVVVNFWFVKCGPCRREIPDLNRLVSKYSKRNDILFLGICLDSKNEIKEFLVKNPFTYRIVANGYTVPPTPQVESFPTHLVLDQSCKVIFSCSESSNRAIWWIDHTIDSCLAVN
jgi:thiol-disulfide isomerase/thioredoxin